eukprot:scaffold2507_cov81-Phaeocystis_antarctica.AAC.3
MPKPHEPASNWLARLIYAIVLDHGLPLRLESIPLLLANVLYRIEPSLLPSLLPTLLAPLHVDQRGKVLAAASSVAAAPHAAQHSAPFWLLLGLVPTREALRFQDAVEQVQAQAVAGAVVDATLNAVAAAVVHELAVDVAETVTR